MKKLIVLFLLFSNFVFSQEDSLKTPQVIDLKQYKITVPDGWRVKEGCVDEKCVLLSPADTLSAYDRFTENISVTINKLTSPRYTADMYADFSKGYLPKVVNNFTVLERKRLKTNEVLMIYRGQKDGYEQTWLQYYIVKNVKVYIITCSIETKNYEHYRPQIEAYAKTFVLK